MKLTFISDTHNHEPVLPGGNILVHTGDLSEHGYRSEILKQLNYLHEQLDKYDHVVLIPGNHDFWAERHPLEFKKACEAAGLHVLVQESVTLEGIKFWGSPATPWFHDWAFNYRIDDIIKVWEQIPKDTQVLLTHGPPAGILDKTIFNSNVGCYALLDQVLAIKPQIHAFGHIHESSGYGSNDDTLFINSAMSIVEVNFDGQRFSVVE